MDTRMCHRATTGWAELTGLLLLAALSALAQPPTAFRPDWRRIGTSSVEMSLASAATGAVDRVWYSPDGATLFARLPSGNTFETNDFESWKAALDAPQPPAPPEVLAAFRPESGAMVRAQSASPTRLYAAGRNVYRSDDGGQNWRNLTLWRQESIIGDGTRDLAVSPRDPDEVVIANSFGVWRSVDGGATWSGLNETLPNLPVRRLVALPRGMGGARLVLDTAGATTEVEWAPGERSSWKPRPGATLAREEARRAALSLRLGVPITARGEAGGYLYAGSADGRIWVSADQGARWLEPQPGTGAAVEAIWIDGADPRRALAALAAREGPRLLRTINGGLFWDDLSGDLPGATAHGVAADAATGAVYLATDRGLFFAVTRLDAAAPAPAWTALGGALPRAAVMDVRLDEGGHQLYVALDGYGVYAAAAPHRVLAPGLVSAADYAERPAAPGALLSILGGRVAAARAGDLRVPVLATSGIESQIQVPFEATGPALSLGLEMDGGRRTLGVPLRDVAPAVFVDRDGTPLLLDADRGLLLDAMTPARSGMRIQILATGLGRVQPEWPTGLAAPIDSPPRVVTPVKVYLGRAPVEVTRATLAPGYIGFYLVEVQLPEIVNLGPEELYLEAGGQSSNRVQIQLVP
jgi:uncharacterized protein (TIGR03437 family)